VTEVEDPQATTPDEDEQQFVAAEVIAQQATARAKKANVSPFRRLYRGQTNFDFVGRRRFWFAISAVVIVVGMSALGIRGLNLGIDFKGGSTWTVLSKTVSQTQVTNVVSAAGLNQPVVEILTNPITGQRTIQVEADLNSLSAKEQARISNDVVLSLAKMVHAYNPAAVAHVAGSGTWTIPGWGASRSTLETALRGIGVVNPTVTYVTESTHHRIQVTADVASLTHAQQAALSKQIKLTMATVTHTYNTNAVSSSFVGPTWGGEITEKALEALIAFFIAVVIYISFRFEPKMALAAFIAMLHDLAVTVGIYAIFGFQVTPDTVVAVLTILGYSLYDTVVVFDRVRDNAKPFAVSGRMTYSAMVNLSMNQTLARSINTSMVAILPVLSVLLIGAELLGAITLQAYGVALTVGLLSGAYSSIFIASPLLAVMKEREQRFRAIRQRLASKGDRMISMSAQDAARFALAAPAAATGSSGPGRQGPAAPRRAPSPRPAPTAPSSAPAPATPVRSTEPSTTMTQQTAPIIQPRARKQKKR
jgi:preprotein translocase subunit SecF